MKRIYPNKDVCIGCHLCEVACLTAHSKSRDIIIAHLEEKAESGLMPRKAVIHAGVNSVAVSCKHCDEPICVTACISGALQKDAETGRVLYDEEQCVGCMSCLMACPYGSIQKHPTSGKIIKCDLCHGLPMPACVAACPNLGLVFEEREED